MVLSLPKKFARCMADYGVVVVTFEGDSGHRLPRQETGADEFTTLAGGSTGGLGIRLRHHALQVPESLLDS